MISLMEQASFHKSPTCNISLATWSKYDFLLFVCIKDRQLQCKPQSVKKKREGGREGDEIKNEQESKRQQKRENMSKR